MTIQLNIQKYLLFRINFDIGKNLLVNNMTFSPRQGNKIGEKVNADDTVVTVL